MTRALLIRHGQSTWNADGRWQGQADPPLTELGRHQALHAARNLGAFDAIVASDLQRALETAELMAGVLGVGPVVTDRRLRERDAGEWSGLTRAEIDSGWPGYLDSQPGDQPDGERLRPPGWETDGALVERAVAGLAQVHDLSPQGEVLVVTHGGLVYALERALGSSFERMANLGGRWIDIGPGGSLERLGERVVLVDPDELTVPTQI